MNERLHELMMEATKDMPQGYYWPGEYVEKFAEAVIRDIMDELSMSDYVHEQICELYGLDYQPVMEKHPNYGDLFTVDEWEESVKCGAFIPDDGDGYWATEKEYSGFSCWRDKPEWATHVLWFNK